MKEFTLANSWYPEKKKTLKQRQNTRKKKREILLKEKMQSRSSKLAHAHKHTRKEGDRYTNTHRKHKKTILSTNYC